MDVVAARINNVISSYSSSSSLSSSSSAANLTQFAWRRCTSAESLSLQSSLLSFCNSVLISTTQQRNRPKPNSRSGIILLPTRCSTKPGIDSDNATNKNPAAIDDQQLDPNSTAQRPATTLPNQALTTAVSKGLVLDLGAKKSWDSAEIGSPVVKRYIGDDEERWFMWYHGRRFDHETTKTNYSDSIGLAVSSNGIHWARGAGQVRSRSEVGLVMSCRSGDWWAFDTDSVRPSELVIMSSPSYSAVYWLYYTGFSSDEVEVSKSSRKPPENPERFYLPVGNQETGKLVKSLPGLACSQDGRNWARIEGDHHSGALFDVGSGKDWDSAFIAAPKVVLHGGGDLRMYYHSFDAENGRFAIGAARSRDGIRWVKLGKILGGGSSGSFDELGVLNGHVVRNPKDGRYFMAYEGVAANGKRSIGVAASPDGVKNWGRVRDDAVLQPSEEDGWDNAGVGSPCLVAMEGDENEWRLYYGGFGRSGRTGIGMAASEGDGVGVFKRREGFQL